jgi:urease accessory protein
MWLLLQLADAAFPTGGFTHSGGLEAAVQLGEVRDEGSLRVFARALLWQTGLGALPFVGAVHDDPTRFGTLDRACDAMLTNHVQNRASRAQGRALLSVACDVFGALLEARDTVTYAHLAPTFGLVTRNLGLPRREALAVFLHGGLRGVLSAAVRLGVTGPHAAQRMQHELGPMLEEILRSSEHIDADDAAQPSPLIDVWQGQHDQLYARLFQS